MKICLINNLYKPYNRGGAERIVELIAAGLQGARHEVFLITTKPITRKHKNTKTRKHKNTKTQKSYFAPLSAAAAGKQKVYYINALYYNLNKLPKILRLFWHLCDMFDIGSYFKVKAILKKEKPDVVMTHNLKGVGYLIPIVIKNLGIKHIHTLHDIQLLHPSGLMMHGKEKQVDSVLSKMYAGICRRLTAGNVKGETCLTSGRLFSLPDIVISPSKWLMKMHTDRGFFKDSRQIVLANPLSGIETQIIENKRNNKIFKFLYVGQIEGHKGVLFLIKVFKMLREELEDVNPVRRMSPRRFCRDKFVGGFTSLDDFISNGVNCELVIVGDGSKLKQAKKLAGDDGGVKFLNKIDNKNLLIMMQEYNILVAPSLCYENSPTVIYEALDAGLPVIASRIGGITELVHKTAGILFKPGNGGDLMYQMNWAIEHREKLQKIGETGREKVKQFGVENYVKELEKLIKN